MEDSSFSLGVKNKNKKAEFNKGKSKIKHLGTLRTCSNVCHQY